MTIKEVPMLTADEKEIVLGGLVYRTSWSTGYEFNKEGKAEIEALRIISLDASKRHFRTRCSGGCEEEHQFSRGCGTSKLWGHLDSAKTEALSKIKNDLNKCVVKQKAVESTITHLEDEIDRIQWLKKIKEPKAVK